MSSMRRKHKSDSPHPYIEFEKTGLWRALNKGIGDLVKNHDLKEATPRDYIVGCLCKVLTKSKDSLFTK
jgi:hypothetical protein